MEINFCPFCSAGSNKMMAFNDLLYCKDCNRFFVVDGEDLLCHKCNKGRIVVSDFPMLNGDVILHCKSCKKMMSAKEFFCKDGSD